MDSEVKNAFGKGESLDDEIPPWALSLFNKMKAEICAETHARIAYTMRLMLDEVKEEIKLTLNAGKPCLRPGVLQQNDECTCKELQHVVKCLKKCGGRRHREEASTGKFQPLASICHAQRKEEKKQAKSEYKAARKERKKAKTRVKSSSTEGETEEFDPIIEKTQSNKTSYQFSGPLPQHPENVKLVSITQILSPPLTPRKISAPFLKVEREAFEQKTTEPEKEDAKEHHLEVEAWGVGQNDSIQSQKTDIELTGKISVKKNPDILNLGPDVLPSLSDSEFEVVSLPPNIKPVAEYPQQAEEESPFLSDYYDEEGSFGGSDAETELMDDEYEINEKIPTKSELYPVEELKKMSISVSTLSTSSTTVVDDFMSSCSNEDNVLEDSVVGAVALPVERQRNPYSVSSEEVKKINIEEIVNHQPLPPEFQRNRNPYAAAIQESENPSLSSQTTTPAEPERAPESSERPRDPYRVDVLPESLWEEAMTVAAKGYNAAKMVVGNLGSLVDPFAPVPETAEQRVSSSPNRFAGATGNTSSISTSMSSSTGVAAGLANQRPLNMTRAEQQLYEMGFTNHALNATLLARHKNDLGKVISELLDH